ncbi:MAG: protein-L-isoaspartate(D-aspartate) O-methyltransferase [Acidobacteriota bacterium]|nr:MAG: protein-L-isoaspartate(D-aspartate) O-methyltransferase [Acidobacteriota bacterium]
MVDEQLVRRSIRDERVLDVMGRIERHRFVPDDRRLNAYGDFPIAIGAQQTLSQPYVVALMTEALMLEGCEKVLEIGTGSGYQTAILAELAAEVFTVELVEELATAARERLGCLGYENVRYRVGDGRLGWPEEAPFDAILVAAAPGELPVGLREQLVLEGRLVIPVGPVDLQELELHERDRKEPSGFRVARLGAVRFVPLV